MSEVPEDEALVRLQLQPEADMFPCCDGTEEISQSSSNDTPAPERTVCQPCSSGSKLVPPTRGDGTSEEEDSDNDEMVSSEAAEGLSEEEVEEASEEAEMVEEDDDESTEGDATDKVSEAEADLVDTKLTIPKEVKEPGKEPDVKKSELKKPALKSSAKGTLV